ncbi:MAG: hypothetical protein LC798_07435 [Chloroflexi bacterium]|nr:hypothetical protein [Chloroflexota bacterium]
MALPRHLRGVRGGSLGIVLVGRRGLALGIGGVAGLERLILLIRGFRRNRDILRAADALQRDLPLSSRAVMAALARGRDPGANGIVIL